MQLIKLRREEAKLRREEADREAQLRRDEVEREERLRKEEAEQRRWEVEQCDVPRLDVIGYC